MELGLLLCDHLALAISGGDRQQIANHMDDLSCWYRSKTGMQLERGGR